MNATTFVSKWGNSHGLRIPSEIFKLMGFSTNDKVLLEVESGSGVDDSRLVISKVAAPQKGTLEYLFKDYSGESFRTDLTNPTQALGNEKW